VLKAIAPELKEATTQEAQAKAHTAQRITTEQAPARALLAKLESLHEQRVSQERAQNRQALTRSTQEREFKGLAAKRQMKVSGWADTGRQWQATPQPLRQLIEAYNATPEAAKAAFLERIHQLPELLRDRQQERGGRGR
jgi:hypothetical protein